MLTSTESKRSTKKKVQSERGNRTRVASLEDCARGAIKGLDLRSDRVTVTRY
jgi:hypothetical protein